MKQSKSREKLILYKLLFTAIILLVYLVGKGLPLYRIDVSAYLHRNVGAEDFLLQTISGDVYQCSLFALGVSPYMISSIVVQVLMAFRSSEARSKISPKKMNRFSLALMLVVAIVQAFLKVQELQFTVSQELLLYTRIIAGVQMIAGAVVIRLLASKNERYGIGGQSAIIYVNIIDGINVMLKGKSLEEIWIPLAISLIVMFIMLIMENTEKRIPVQRISIHNIYADKNYLAIKLNPIGVMPAMFSMAFFMLPQLLLSLLLWCFPENLELIRWQVKLTLTNPIGITVYIAILYFLTIVFSRVFVNPREITEQFLKSGDSILDIHAGKDTKKYLSGVITRISIFSATVMSICLGVPLVLQLMGVLESSLATLPSSVMMLTGIWCNIYREFLAIKDLEAYKPFI